MTRQQLNAQITTRVSSSTRDELEQLARDSGEVTLSFARRLLEEGVKRERHPGVTFRTGATGRRAALEGRGMDVWRVMETVWASDGDVDAAAEYLHIAPHEIRAAVAYYADYPEEIDERVRHNRETAERMEAAWLRQQAALKK
jgi:uncharacterized protein (DUF433 family)